MAVPGAGIGSSQTLDGGGKVLVRNQWSSHIGNLCCVGRAPPPALTNPFSSPVSGICLGSKMIPLHPALQAGDKGSTGR